ncbi:hypothetical protein GCM10028797_22730 [Dyella agri]
MLFKSLLKRVVLLQTGIQFSQSFKHTMRLFFGICEFYRFAIFLCDRAKFSFHCGPLVREIFPSAPMPNVGNTASSQDH